MLLTKMAEKVGISPWEIRYRNAIRPGQELPNGQLVDDSTGLAETLEAVKEVYDSHPYAGIACAMKNAGVGVGLPDWGRCKLYVHNGKVEIHSEASCIGQGLGTVLVQIVSEKLGDVYKIQTELYVPHAMGEYIKAWFILHVMAKELDVYKRQGCILSCPVFYRTCSGGLYDNCNRSSSDRKRYYACLLYTSHPFISANSPSSSLARMPSSSVKSSFAYMASFSFIISYLSLIHI